MENNTYALTLGRLVTDFHALELNLRHFLHHLDMPGSAASDLEALPPGSRGQVVPSGALTNPDSLATLIEKYNRAVRDAKQDAVSIDPGLAETREALVNGRTWGSEVSPPLRIVQFSRPANGLVTCTFDELVDQG